MATRVRDELTIFTDDRDALLRAVESNAGDKASALEHVGKAPSAASPGSQGRDDEAPARAGDGERNVTFAIDGSTVRSRPERQASPVQQLGSPPSARKNRWSWDCDRAGVMSAALPRAGLRMGNGLTPAQLWACSH
jgi:hypothetical protein